MYRDKEIEARNLVGAEQWRQFMESTAAALQISLTFFVLKSKDSISVCKKCPFCGEEAHPFDPSLIGEDGNIASESDGIEFFILKGSYAVIARKFCCGGDDTISFREKVKIAEELLTDFINILTEKWDGGSLATELAALHQINHIVLSMFRGDNKALDRVLDLILSAAVILFDAEGSWLDYTYCGQRKLLTKGASPQDSENLSNDFYSITAEIKNPVIQGIIGTVEPMNTERAEMFLDFMTQECSIVFEIDYLLNMMETKLSLILGTVDSTVLLIDRRKNICYANRAASKLLSTPVEELLDLPISRNDAPWVDCILSDTASVTKGIKDEFTVNGTTFLVDWEVFPLKGEEIPGWLLMARDCTSVYRIQDMGKMIESMAKNADLVNVIAHEIRNPLATLKGVINLIDCKFASPELRKYLNVGLDEIKAISLLLDDLTVLGRIQVASFEPFDLKSFLEDSATLLKSVFNGPDLELRLELYPTPPIYADKRQLSHVITNLVKNAYEAMEGRGIITLSLKQAGKKWVELKVKDSGPGIPDSIINNLFKPYCTTKVAGNGLGLAIINEIIQSHGGKITVNNNRDKGACFSILLPVCREEDNDEPQQTGLLLVSGDDTVKLPVERVFVSENIGYHSISKIDCLFDIIHKTKPSVMVIDDSCLSCDTLDTIRTGCPTIKKVILGSKFNIKDENLIFISKPICYAKLLNIVRAFLDETKEK